MVQEELPLCIRYYQGIKKFLNYVENEHAEDEFTRLLDKEVKNARLNEEWRSEYLKTYVNDMDMRREGYIEGEKFGLERGKAEGEKLGRAEGERERDRTLINQWLQKGKVSIFLFALVSSLSFILTGCGKTDLSDETSEQESETTCLVQNTEAEEKNNLDNWIGQYAFDEAYSEEGYAPMFMDYDINIYKENNQYYADVVVNGQMTGINLKARLYGSDEWVSLVIEKYNPEHITGLSKMENTVLLSLERQGGDLYTYWGVLYPLAEDLPVSGIYFEKVTEEETVQIGSSKETNGLEDWVGNYAFSEELGKSTEELRDYEITIYEEDGQYYADLKISGGGIGIDVKAKPFGNDEWISLVLIGYNPGHKSGLETMENGVLLSLRKQGEDIYTYWGGRDVTELLSDSSYGYFAYYDSVRFFEKIGEEKE